MSFLAYSVFQDVFFPHQGALKAQMHHDLKLEQIIRFQVTKETLIHHAPLIVFDVETTGLDAQNDYLIEIGALRILNGSCIEQFSTLIKPPVPVTEAITAITGIDEAMLENQPTIEQVLPKFLKFIDQSILVAHNANFDMNFLRNVCHRQGIQLDWPALCTLKLARHLLPDLQSRSLDTLASHYQLTFESRHRSIGDCKVTNAVLQALLHKEAPHLVTWDHLQPFTVT